MSKHILVDATLRETRVALLEHGVVQDIFIERAQSQSLVGNVYVGKVVRVLPGMQSAFVDFGSQRTGFIVAADVVVPASRGREEKQHTAAVIAKHLYEGKKIIVQVVRDAHGTKGARLSMRISLATRYLILLPQANRVSVSHSIKDPRERTRLQRVLMEVLKVETAPDAAGFVLRTAAEGVGPEEIASDIRYLGRLWTAVSARAKAATSTELLHAELSLPLRMVRDLACSALERIWVDDQECLTLLQAFCAEWVPEMVSLLELHSVARPLFDLHGVEDEIRQALARRVELPAGGYLVFDQTEAMTTVDVNTGSFIGQRDPAETILATNLEAVAVLARQLRLRNLGGIVVVDFIDMEAPEHRQRVRQALDTLLQRDPVRSQITNEPGLGLVAITRKRTRDSLAHTLCEACPVCEGRAVVKTAETVCYEILRQIMRDARDCRGDTLLVLAAQSVVDRLRVEEADYLANLAAVVGKTISVRAESSYRHEQYAIRPL